jgi:hypothetical protein
MVRFGRKTGAIYLLTKPERQWNLMIALTDFQDPLKKWHVESLISNTKLTQETGGQKPDVHWSGSTHSR